MNAVKWVQTVRELVFHTAVWPTNVDATIQTCSSVGTNNSHDPLCTGVDRRLALKIFGILERHRTLETYLLTYLLHGGEYFLRS
jgi:hypothetical protein